ncbi:MAG: hypothetical protein U0599_17415 [Vicinamibacteria bacterium]
MLADEPERGEQRALVRGEGSHAHVDERVRRGVDAGVRAQVRGQTLAGGAPHLAEAAAEAGVEGQRLEPVEPGRLLRPPAADRVGEQLREVGVRVVQPRAGEDGRGPGVERLREEDREVLERLAAGAVPRRRDVGPARREDGQDPRPEALGLALAEEREAAAPLGVTGPAGLDRVEVAAVHLVDELQEARGNGLEERHGPEGPPRLRLRRGVTDDGRGAHPRPRLVPAELALVEEHAQGLGHGQGAALVDEEEDALRGERRADRLPEEGELVAQAGLRGLSGERWPQDVGLDDAAGPAGGRDDLGRPVGTRLDRDDVQGAQGRGRRHGAHSPPPGRRAARRRPRAGPGL